MSQYITIGNGQKYIYKVEILRVFKVRTQEERDAGVERERLAEPILIALGWYDNPTSARSFGSLRTGRSEWYHHIGKPEYEYVKVDIDGNRIGQYEWPKGYRWEKRDIPKPYEPDLDYRVYKVPVSLNMGEAVQLPALKKLYEVE